MPRSQRHDLEMWAALTIQIGSDFIASARQKEKFYQALMILTDPNHYQIGSNMWKLLTRLRKELQHAAQRATQATQGIQTRGSPSTTPVPSTGSKRPNTPNHAVTSQTMTSRPRPKIISPAPIINPYKVDGRTERDNNTTNEILYEQEMRRALKESLVSLKREQNYTPDN